MNYNINLNKSFKFKNKISKRSIQISEAFGVGLESEKEFKVFDNIRLNFKNKFVIYVTGDSGGGKSTLLNLINEKFDDITINYKNIKINETEIVCEGVGKDLNSALKILNIVGLSDAFVYLRQYNQLSDGQKMRYKIAKMIDSEKTIFIIDEFCALLDRDTAKIISFNIQKYIRKNNKILFVATTHDDLDDDLNSDIYIYKKFEDDLDIHHRSDEFSTIEYKNKCSVIDEMKFVKLKNAKDVESLHKFHYRSNSGTAKHIYGLKHKDKLISYMMLSQPLLLSKGRNVITNNKYSKITSENMKLVNKDFERISRIVVHPKYRGIGLSQYIIKTFLNDHCEVKFVEAMSVMSNYNPFFEKSGMKKVDFDSTDRAYEKLIEKLIEIGFESNMLKSFEYFYEIYINLSNENKKTCDIILDKLYHRMNARSNVKNASSKNDISEYKSFHSKLFKNDILYYFWENKNFTEKQTNINVNTLF